MATLRTGTPTVGERTDDRLDPVANDHTLARLIPRARLMLYPDAAHGFVVQDGTRFASLVSSFLTGRQGSERYRPGQGRRGQDCQDLPLS